MKVSYKWLKDYVEISTDPRKLARLLTMSGANVESWEKVGGDYIFEFEITANRADLLSILGIAREIAALFGKKLKVPKELKGDKGPRLQGKRKPSFAVKVEDSELCPRYTARVIRDVEVKPSPEWLKERIISAGLRPVNNIVDITNFVLLETGQPLHAFDLDRIRGGISVRRSRKDEKIVTIDNTPRTCGTDMLAIADESGPLAIAGVMGGLATEVGDMSRNLLLESASFDPVSIRRTSRALGISSESSYRFERRIDEAMLLGASERASALIAEIAGGKIGPITDVGRKKPYERVIKFDPEKTNSLLGISIKRKKALEILKSLGFLTRDKKGAVKVTVPSFRGDVKSDVDLAEEIARVYGYENIPLTIPRIVGNTRIKDFISIFIERVSRNLTRLGLNEIITYSMISRKSVAGLDFTDNKPVTIKNPLSIDQEILRPSMLPGMLGAISYNFKRYAKRLSFFELGKVYKEKGDSFIEEAVLSLGMAGVKHETWKGREEGFDFFDIKGTFEALFKDIGITDGISFKKGKSAGLDGNSTSVIEHSGAAIGRLGEVGLKFREKFDIKRRVFYGEIYIRSLLKKARLEKNYAPYSRYPSIIRDISILLDKNVASREVTGIIKEIGRGLVKGARPISFYKGKEIPEGKRALLYRIEYRSDERTLQDAEVDELHSKIKSELSSKLSASFR
jgi:phenylalanyl-tRNA synthetase beta chain